MGFESGKRRGSLWEDAKKLDKFIRDFEFNITGVTERSFEGAFSSSLRSRKKVFKNQIISQTGKSTTVKSVYCLGKNHRPDLTINEDGIALEIKFFSYDQLKNAIGQGYLYRLRYRFVFLILIVSEKKKDLYEEVAVGKEKDLEDMLTDLSTSMNIFTYIVPSFNTKTGIKKCISFFT